MELALLRDVIVIFGLAVTVLYVFHRIRAPTIVGFLLTGILAGPQGLGFVKAAGDVADLAEIGVILLLFTIGLEISLKDLLKIKKYVLVGGSLQVLLTTAAVIALLAYIGEPMGEAILLGFLISLSSTAIVLRIIQKREEFDSLHGRTILGILIFQDIAIIPMMLVTPLLPGSSEALSPGALVTLGKGLAAVTLVILAAKWVVPRALYHIARTGDRELFLLSIVAICFAVAWVTSAAGLSLGLGAFLAGLIISESEYSHQAFGNILPLRDAFTSFFFISIGMLVDVGFFLKSPGFIILIALAVIVLKSVVAGLAITLMGLPLRITVVVGLALSQIGEFSFVLSKVGLDAGLLSQEVYQLFIDVTVITMAATTFIMAISPRVADSVMKLRLPGGLKRPGFDAPLNGGTGLKDHLIIVGYGINGRNVARSAGAEGIPYVILEMDPEIVRHERSKGEPIFYGDACQDSVLEHAGIRAARVLVIAISDPASTRRITVASRRLNPGVYIIARTRYIDEMKPLHDLGASDVIPEEYETSIEIFSRVLERYQVPRMKIQEFIDQIRADGYEMFRSISQEPYCDGDISLASTEMGTLRVEPGSFAEGRSIDDMGMKGHGIALLAVNRVSREAQGADSALRLQAGDVAVFLGPPEKIDMIARLFKPQEGNGETGADDADVGDGMDAGDDGDLSGGAA